MNGVIAAASQWKFGVNDPTFIAWVIFVVYFVAAIRCWRARGGECPPGQPKTRLLWTLLTICLVLLGLNKQLDLHQLLMETVRDQVTSQDGKGVSRTVLGMVAAVGGVIGLTVLGYIANLLWRSNHRLRGAYGIFAVLLGFQVVRFLPGPISGLLVTHVLTDEGLLHIHIIELLELGSLVAIAWLATAPKDQKGHDTI